MTSWNRVEGTKQCLESLFEHTFGDYNIYITDNGSTDGTVEYLKSLSGYPIEMTFLRENIGIASARNAHWYKCAGNDVVRMDNDIVIKTDDWFEILRDIAYRHHAFVGIIPDSYLPLIPDITRDLIFTDELPQHEKYLYSVAGNLMFIPKAASDIIGHWCEDYGLYAFEDTDYALRGEVIGYGQIFTTLVKHDHLYPEMGADKRLGLEICNHYWDIVKQNLINFGRMLANQSKEEGGLEKTEPGFSRFNDHKAIACSAAGIR